MLSSTPVTYEERCFMLISFKKRHDSINPYWYLSHVFCKFWKFCILAKFHSKLKCCYIPSLFNITCKVNIPTKWKHAVRNRHLQSHPPDATCHFLLKSKYHLIEVGLFLILLVNPFEALEIQQVTQSLGASTVSAFLAHPHETVLMTLHALFKVYPTPSVIAF